MNFLIRIKNLLENRVQYYKSTKFEGRRRDRMLNRVTYSALRLCVRKRMIGFEPAVSAPLRSIQKPRSPGPRGPSAPERMRLKRLEVADITPFAPIKKKRILVLRILFLFIGATGFEPATSASRTQRSTKLSHAPLY